MLISYVNIILMVYISISRSLHYPLKTKGKYEDYVKLRIII